MTPPPNHPQPVRWSTSSYGDVADTSPGELSALREHLDLCCALHRRWFRTRCGAEAMHDFVVARLVTSVVVATSLIALVLWLA